MLTSITTYRGKLLGAHGRMHLRVALVAAAALIGSAERVLCPAMTARSGNETETTLDICRNF